MRCVIVDDDEGFLDVARALLERDGVIVAGVRSDVVIVDDALNPVGAPV